MNIKRTAILLPIFILLFCAIYAYLTANLPSRKLKGIVTVGPSFIPWVLVIATSILALAELIANIGKPSKKQTTPVTVEGSKSRDIRNICVITIFALYIGLMPTFGFLILTILFAAVFIIIIRGWNWPTLLITPLVLGFGFYFVFVKLLNVPLPGW